jgi:hypothetical protein
MKTASVLIPLAILIGVALWIIPGPRDHSPPSYHGPERAKLRNVGKALIVFEESNGRRVTSYEELSDFVRRSGRDYGIRGPDLTFTSPAGAAFSWVLYPTINGVDYLVASPPYEWHGESRRLVYRLIGNQEESEIIK